MAKEPSLHIVEHPTSNIIVAKGKLVNTQSIVEHYNYLNVQARKDRENKEDKLKSTQPPQLISALDKESQLMKIAVIQPPIAGDVQSEKVTEFKFSKSQFSVVDKLDFFKQTSDLIFSDLISTSVSKDKLHKYFKKLENKLKT